LQILHDDDEFFFFWGGGVPGIYRPDADAQPSNQNQSAEGY